MSTAEDGREAASEGDQAVHSERASHQERTVHTGSGVRGGGERADQEAHCQFESFRFFHIKYVDFMMC